MKGRLVIGMMFASILVSLGSAYAAVAGAMEGIKGQDDRVTVPSDEFPWSAIGRINTETGGHCTGVMVGPSLVMTAAHCLYDKPNRRYVPQNRVHFVAGYRDGDYVAHTIARRYVLPDEFSATGPKLAENATRDWAFVELEEEIGFATGWFGMENFNSKSLSRHRQQGTVFIQAGYSSDKKRELTAHLGCVLEGYVEGHALLVHGCDAVPGDSGSPIFIFKDGLPYLTSVHVATTSEESPTRGVSVPTETFFQQARDTGAQDPHVPSTDNLLPRKSLRFLLMTLGYDGDGELDVAIRNFQHAEGQKITGNVGYELVGLLIAAMGRDR
jgi:protease YdgD